METHISGINPMPSYARQSNFPEPHGCHTLGGDSDIPPTTRLPAGAGRGRRPSAGGIGAEAPIPRRARWGRFH